MPDELSDQIAASRAIPGVTGQIFFSAKYIVNDTKGLNGALRYGEYAQVASQPLTPWLRSRR